MRYKGIDEHAVKTACFFAFKLTSWIWFKSYEKEDIEQELIIEYLIKKKEFDSSRGSKNTYINAVMLNKARDMLRKRRAEKRGRNCEVPLEWETDYWDDSDCTEQKIRDFENQYDLNKIMGFLDEYEKALCLCLMQGLSINETIKKLGIGKSTFYKTMERIRRKI